MTTMTAADVEEVTQSEVIKFSAGGFRDFTRIAASDPTMWRDVFLANKDAVLEMLQRFTEDLTALQRVSLNGNYQDARILPVLTSGAATAMWLPRLAPV